MYTWEHKGKEIKPQQGHGLHLNPKYHFVTNIIDFAIVIQGSKGWGQENNRCVVINGLFLDNLRSKVQSKWNNGFEVIMMSSLGKNMLKNMRIARGIAGLQVCLCPLILLHWQSPREIAEPGATSKSGVSNTLEKTVGTDPGKR